jgi:chlorite dismutase
MKMFWLFLIGVAVGVGFTLLVIFLNFKVRDREWWEKREREMDALHSSVEKVVAENSQLRVALAAAELTEDAKKVVTMTMAALETDIIAAEKAAQSGWVCPTEASPEGGH